MQGIASRPKVVVSAEGAGVGPGIIAPRGPLDHRTSRPMRCSPRNSVRGRLPLGRPRVRRVRSRTVQMQYRPGLLAGFLASTGLDLSPV